MFAYGLEILHFFYAQSQVEDQTVKILLQYVAPPFLLSDTCLRLLIRKINCVQPPSPQAVTSGIMVIFERRYYNIKKIGPPFFQDHSLFHVYHFCGNFPPAVKFWDQTFVSSTHI